MIRNSGSGRGESAASGKDRNILLGLVTLTALSEALYLRLLRFNAIDGLRPVATFVVVLLALFAICGFAFMLLRRIRFKMKAALVVVVFGAAAFRITMIPAGLPPNASPSEVIDLARADLQGSSVSFDRYLLYDDDVWRYLWDGHVWANSVNPFELAPASPKLDWVASSRPSTQAHDSVLWRDIRENINHAQIPTIYPPLAQVVFRLSHALAPGSVIVLKTILVSFDFLTMWLIHLVFRHLGSHPGWLVLYAWNPLLIKVVAGSGHIDVLVGTLLALTAYLLVKQAHFSAALALAGAALVKLAPLVLLPLLIRRIGWRRSLIVPLVMLAAYLPFLHAGSAAFAGFIKFAREWEFNSTFFMAMRSLAQPFARDPGLVAREAGALAILLNVVWAWKRDDGQPASFARLASYLLGTLILFSPTVMPWYLIWLLPMAVLARTSIWIWFTAIVCLAFFVMVDGTERTALVAIEYGWFAAVALTILWRRKDSRARHESENPTESLTADQTLSPLFGVKSC